MSSVVTHSHLEKALAALREEMRGELRAALEAKRLGYSIPEGGGREPCDECGPEPGDEGGPEAVGRVSEEGGSPEPCDECGPEPGDDGGPEAVDLLKLDEEYAFNESVWDAANFIAIGKLGQYMFGSVVTAFALLANMILQISMCIVINDALTRSPMSEADIEQLQYWRATIAHNVKYVDEFAWESFTARVCTFQYAPMSDLAIRALEAIQEYKPNATADQYLNPPQLGQLAGPIGTKVGEAFCCIALIIWWTTVLREVYSVIDMTMSIALLPRGRTVVSRTDKGYKLESVSAPRRCWIGAIALLRTCIAVVLLVCGTLYLVTTISLGDLILNAVALEIVLNLDELLFTVLVPVSTRKLTQSMEPLSAGRSAVRRGLDYRPVFAMLLYAAALAYVIIAHLDPQLVMLERARDAVCGGNQDFVAGIDQAGMVWASNPISDTEATNAHGYKAMRHVIEHDGEVELGSWSGEWMTLNWWQGVYGGSHSVDAKVNSPVEYTSGFFNPNCLDADTPGFGISWGSDYWRVAVEILKDATGATTISSCEDMRRYCLSGHGKIGLRVRQYCPQTCGCDDPSSGLWLPSANHGCPRSCRFSDLYHDQLKDLRCEDFDPNSPQMINGTNVISVYMSHTMHWRLEYEFYYSMYYWDEYTPFESALWEGGGGCLEAARILRQSGIGDLCEETNTEGLMPITFLCPETCRCDLTGALLCPPACGLD